MTSGLGYALMLRFRDLVTEPGGNIAEHRRILRQHGSCWWGWWARSHEVVPRDMFGQLLPSNTDSPLEGILFDRGMLRLYRTTISRIVVAPSHLGVHSPSFETTPEYYVRGRYPAWFRLEGDISPIEGIVPRVVARPTESDATGVLKADLQGEPIGLSELADERPTLWVISKTENQQ